MLVFTVAPYTFSYNFRCTLKLFCAVVLGLFSTALYVNMYLPIIPEHFVPQREGAAPKGVGKFRVILSFLDRVWCLVFAESNYSLRRGAALIHGRIKAGIVLGAG